MKKALLTIPVLLLMSFSKCDKDSFDKKPPIKFSETYFEKINAPASTKITLISDAVNSSILFDSIYFHGKMNKIEQKTIENKLILTSEFIKLPPHNMNLHADPKKEFGNTPPKVEPKIPFELKNNEAVLSYFIDDEKRYFKLNSIIEKK